MISQKEAALRLQAMFRGNDARRRVEIKRGKRNQRSSMDMLEAEDVLMDVSTKAHYYFLSLRLVFRTRPLCYSFCMLSHLTFTSLPILIDFISPHYMLTTLLSLHSDN